MRALPGASLRFLSIKTIDGFEVHAALWQPENKPPVDTTMIVQVHGSGGNLASLPLRVIARALSAKGYAALSISTRQRDEHVNTDNFFEVRRDIETAVATVRALGYWFVEMVQQDAALRDPRGSRDQRPRPDDALVRRPRDPRGRKATIR
jgi:hypothetical protein